MTLVTSPRALEFACNSKACAPPPVGRGGSGNGGRSGRPVGPAAREQPGSGRSGSPVRPNPIGPGAGRNPNQKMIDSTIRAAERKGGTAGTTTAKKAPGKVKEISGYELKRGDRIHFAQSVKTVSSVGKQRNGRIGVSFTSGGVTDVAPGQKFTVAGPAKTVKTKSKGIPAGNAGQYKQASPDKKWAANPNNPRNQQRHPDDDRASKRIIRP